LEIEDGGVNISDYMALSYKQFQVRGRARGVLSVFILCWLIRVPQVILDECHVRLTVESGILPTCFLLL
jgi:hypothetical protein